MAGSDGARELYARALKAYAAGDLDRARLLCERAVARAPRLGEAWDRLGRIADRRGELGEARRLYEQAIPLLAKPAETVHNLALLLHRLGDADAAIEQYRRAQALGLVNARLHANLGSLLRDRRRLGEAEAELRRALALDPRSAAAHSNLGVTLGVQGRLPEALGHLGEAVQLEPQDPLLLDNLLLYLHYADGIPPADIAALARRYGQLVGQIVGGPPVEARTAAERRARRPAGSRLRVGFVSPDLRQHPVRYFLEPLLAHRDRQRMEVIAYADVARPDAGTERLRPLFDRWHDSFALPHAALLDAIRADELDLLIDLAGHTAHNRLPVFAARGAPVQVSYLGYPGTTGLAAMDFRLTDTWADPPGAAEPLHSERLLRFPRGFLCYQPPDSAPSVAPPPALARGAISFGCFNNLAKLSGQVMGLWAELLGRVPGARLVLKSLGLGEAHTRAAVERQLAERGVPVDRVTLQPPVAGEADHLGAYDQVDVALDSFPYHGTTTTCEALWMGVPVVTLAGAAHHSRVGVSLLQQVGLPEMIAERPEDYVAIAARLAADPAALAAHRQGLRDRLRRSPLCDGSGQAQAFDQLLREAVG